MKARQLVWLIGIAVVVVGESGLADTNRMARYVTNWVAAPAHFRLTGKEAQDTLKDPSWRAISIPVNTPCEAVYRGNGKVEPVLLSFQNGIIHTRVHNFPYDPRMFGRDLRVITKNEAKVNTTPLSFRAKFLKGETNYATAGGRITSMFLEYDHGLPCTNKIPVVRKLW